MVESSERPLRVGLNLIFLQQASGGTGRYARELARALLAVEPRTELHLFVSPAAPADLWHEPWAERVRFVRCPAGRRGGRAQLLFQFAALPPLAAARRLDVLHSLANLGPAVTPGVASVVSLLDLIWMRPPEQWGGTPGWQRSLRRLVEYSVRRADRVLTISRAAATEISSELHVPAERIEVTPLGVSPPAAAPASAAEVRAELGLGDSRVVLSVAQKHPYKNLHRLIRALPALPVDVVLVLPGFSTPHEQELRALAQELGVGDRVLLPAWLSEASLAGLYALSSAFVLPSLVEGFGLPVLEAMSRGVPVACSNASSLPEVAGDAALLFDPEDQDGVTSAIGRLLEDPELAAELVRRGRRRACEYTWERTAQATLGAYRRALAAREGRRRTFSRASAGRRSSSERRSS